MKHPETLARPARRGTKRMAACGLLLASIPAAAELGEGVFGAALDANQAAVCVAATPAFAQCPAKFFADGQIIEDPDTGKQ